MTNTVIVTEPPEVAVPSPWRNGIARTTTLGGGTPNTGAWTLFRPVPAEFNHWMWAHHTGSSRRPSSADSASEDTVQCYRDFWLRPRHWACLLQQYSIACTVADNSGRPSLRSAERGDLFVPWTRTTCSEGGASSSQLQLSGTHCRFTFAPRPSVAVSFEQGSRLIFKAGLSLTFPLRTVDEIELNWTDRAEKVLNFGHLRPLGFMIIRKWKNSKSSLGTGFSNSARFNYIIERRTTSRIYALSSCPKQISHRAILHGSIQLLPVLTLKIFHVSTDAAYHCCDSTQ